MFFKGFQGPTQPTDAGDYVISGGGDGSVLLFDRKSAKAMWAIV